MSSMSWVERKQELRKLQEIGYKRQRAAAKLEELDQALIAQARVAYDNGAAGPEIAETMGISLRTLWRRFADAA